MCISLCFCQCLFLSVCICLSVFPLSVFMYFHCLSVYVSTACLFCCSSQLWQHWLGTDGSSPCQPCVWDLGWGHVAGPIVPCMHGTPTCTQYMHTHTHCPNLPTTFLPALIKSDLRRHNINVGIMNGTVKAVSGGLGHRCRLCCVQPIVSFLSHFVFVGLAPESEPRASPL